MKPQIELVYLYFTRSSRLQSLDYPLCRTPCRDQDILLFVYQQFRYN